MGMKSNSNHFNGTNGCKMLLKLDLQQFANMPIDNSQIKHIMRKALGHLEDTPLNRQLLIDLSNDEKYFLGIGFNNIKWYAKTLPNGSQLWVTVRDGIIQNGGLNNKAIDFVPNVGLRVKKIERIRK